MLDLKVGLDLTLDLPANLLPQRVSVGHLATLHAHVSLHCFQEGLTSIVLDQVSFKLQGSQSFVCLSDVLSDGQSSFVPDFIPSKVEGLDEIFVR